MQVKNRKQTLAGRMANYSLLSAGAIAAASLAPSAQAAPISFTGNYSTGGGQTLYFDPTSSTQSTSVTAGARFQLWRTGSSFRNGGNSGMTFPASTTPGGLIIPSAHVPGEGGSFRFKTGAFFGARASAGVVGSGFGGPAKLGAGAAIQPGLSFDASATLDFWRSSSKTTSRGRQFSWGGSGPRGNWGGDGSGYVGFDFTEGGQTDYGWAYLQLEGPSGINLLAWGYDNAGNAIHAGETGNGGNGGNPTVIPEPGSLALLALGATGLALYRRRRKAAQAPKN